MMIWKNERTKNDCVGRSEAAWPLNRRGEAKQEDAVWATTMAGLN